MQIFIKLLTGKTITVNVASTDTVTQVKQKVQELQQVPASEQRLIYSGNNLEDAKTLGEYDIPKEATLYLISNASSAASRVIPGKTEEIQITVKTSATETLLYNVVKTLKVAELKNMIADKTGVAAGTQTLYLGQKALNDARTLEQEEVTTGALITVVAMVRGGSS